MPDATGHMVQFRDSDTKELLFQAKMFFMPQAGESVRHNGYHFTVTEVGYIFTTPENPRISYCPTRPVVLIEPV